MQVYDAPLRDMRFLLHEVLDVGGLPGMEDLDAGLIDGILDEAARFLTATLLPLNAGGDRGCVLEKDGTVRTPDGFRDAYRAFRDGGWCGLDAAPAWGGQGLPAMIAKLVEEMTCSANLGFTLFPGLSRGAVVALEAHGDAALKARYLPPLVEGRWTGTMCLTEAQAGTDLGLIRTRAAARPDGTYGIAGTKIFISAGEHDLAENIIHLVLARLPGAPPGIKGISLFLVPKFLVGADGAPGPRNAVFCTRIEHKMGMKASPTCEMVFEDATGFLVGEPGRGVHAMFTMMNQERLSIGWQGLGIAETAYQSAAAYARERLQGRAAGGARRPDLPADPIIVHPDVRRMLLTMRAVTQGCRALGLWTARALDLAARAPDPAVRAAAAARAALLTPVVKALFTDYGFEMASLAVQVHGGSGYIADMGVEQFVRDARIAMIYEGTNGIQALDLVGRKLPAEDGKAIREVLAEIARGVAEAKAVERLASLAAAVGQSLGWLEAATAFLAGRGPGDAEEPAAAAADYLKLFGLVLLGHMWLRMALAAAGALGAGTGEAAFYEAKLATARFFMDRLLPQGLSLLHIVEAGKASTMELPAEAF